MEFGGVGNGRTEPEHGHSADEWNALLLRTVAHLAAQVTVTQLQVRALASELEARGLADPDAVGTRVRALALTRTGEVLRENLGEALAEAIEIEELEAQIVAHLSER